MNLRSDELETVVRWFMRRMSITDREDMMRTFPAFYNALVEREVVRVVKVHIDGTNRETV